MLFIIYIEWGATHRTATLVNKKMKKLLLALFAYSAFFRHNNRERKANWLEQTGCSQPSIDICYSIWTCALNVLILLVSVLQEYRNLTGINRVWVSTFSSYFYLCLVGFALLALMQHLL